MSLARSIRYSCFHKYIYIYIYTHKPRDKVGKSSKNMSSFNAYGKVDEAEQAKLEARRKRRKGIAIISLSSIILVGVVVAAVFGTRAGSGSKNGGGVGGDKSPATSIKAICDFTSYPETCYSSLASLPNSTQVEPVAVFKLAIQVAMTELSNAAQRLSEPSVLGGSADNRTAGALKICQELFSLAMDHLNLTLSAGSTSLFQVMDDLKTWLSSAGTVIFNHLIYILILYFAYRSKSLRTLFIYFNFLFNCTYFCICKRK
jgi:pectinesterase inhibitor-like protein